MTSAPRFIHLRVHTEYSLLEGAVRVKCLPGQVAAIAALVVTLWILVVLARPVKAWKAALVAAMAGIAATAVAVPPVRAVFELDVPMTLLPQALAIGAAGAIGVELIGRRAQGASGSHTRWETGPRRPEPR